MTNYPCCFADQLPAKQDVNRLYRYRLPSLLGAVGESFGDRLAEKRIRQPFVAATDLGIRAGLFERDWQQLGQKLVVV
jgi:hypothetical protein